MNSFAASAASTSFPMNSVLVTQMMVRCSVPKAAQSLIYNRRMNHHSTDHTKKRCSECDHFFSIPKPKGERLRNLMIEYFPCTHCGHAKQVWNRDKSVCKVCFLPIAIVKHHSHGTCSRCVMNIRRNKASEL